MKFIDRRTQFLPKDAPPFIWTFCTEKLPLESGRFLGWCLLKKDECMYWRGVMDVYYDPCVGWSFNWEKEKENQICVIKWMEFPFEIEIS